MTTADRKKAEGRCVTLFCRNMGRMHSGGYRRAKCYKCASRDYAQRHPAGYYFFNLRNRAKQRGHSFALTLDWFRQWCRETGILETKGKTASSMSIDRINPARGYEPGNLRVVTLSENSRLAHSGFSGNEPF